MPEFNCIVCGATFAVAEGALQKYPGWTPKYCRAHSPRKKSEDENKAPRRAVGASATRELDLTLREVLERFPAGPAGGPQTGIFTDGSARPNPGPGGWGIVRVQDGEILLQRYGHDPQTTNNRMELTALLEAFQCTAEQDEMTIYSDSELCVKTLNEWAGSWEKKGWRRKSGPIMNLDLVRPLYEIKKSRPKVKVEWAAAHNGWRWNEYADSLATAWARTEL